MKEPVPLTIEIPGGGAVSALLDKPARPLACYVFAHGAGAGMTHRFMQAVATGLVTRNIATRCYQVSLNQSDMT
ncbi:alpha/beta family hydrolase [Pseudorhodoplanes sp.]|uniref:alpha/beta family hydrolase n=1 Tax=Pseudorhodoplanes sp. TaxID=1934341 RepID=UPI002CC6BF1A|nr:alpha/beta family hydrolase [Pseudorhodoplanes sp.]HWV52605.1 alpha/beta family hydrolase [Pseudorhodoplanes sp.]